jgi:hypothetical protein
MPATSGLSFYLSDFLTPSTAQSITYGIEALSNDDITVVFINGSDVRVVLTKDVDYTVDALTKTVTCTAATWISLASVSAVVDSSSKLRIYRTTSVLPVIDFKSGAVLSESDLDNSYKQGLFAAQEMTEDAADTNAGVQTVTTGAIEAGAVTGDKIAAGAVDTLQLANASVDNTKLQPGAVNQLNLQASSINTASLALGAVTHDRLAADAVETDNIKDANVTQAKVDKASVADMEGQSSTDGVVTPDVLKHSPFSPTCYGSVAYESGSAVRSPGFYNVNSSTETQTTANYSRKIIFANNMDNTNYVVVGSVGGTGTGLSNDGAVAIQEKNVGYFVLQTAEPEASGRYLDFVVFGSTLLS